MKPKAGVSMEVAEGSVDSGAMGATQTRWRLRLAALLVVVLGAGAVLTVVTVRQTRNWMREDLLARTARLARGIQADYVRQFSGTEADLELPAYQRMKQFLMTVQRQCTQCRFIYLMGRQPDGSIVILADGEPPDSSDYSPPGDLYVEAGAVEQAVFDKGIAHVVEAATDRWGTWVSAAVPVFDHRTGDVLALFGMDIAADDWAQRVRRSAVAPVLLTLALVVLSLGGAWSYRRNRLRNDLAHPLLQGAEIVIVLLSGALLTCYAVWAVARIERHGLDRVFRQLAESELDRMQQSFVQLRDYHLPTLARFMEASEAVTAAEFQHFVASAQARYPGQAWGWIPIVGAAEREAYEVAAGRREGAFPIWEYDAQGVPAAAGRRAVYYPLRYVVPLREHGRALGFDLGSEALRLRAITDVVQVGLPVVTDPLQLAEDAEPRHAMQFLHPVRALSGNGALQGLVVIAVRLEDHLRNIWKTSPLHCQVALLREEGPPLLLHASDVTPAPREAAHQVVQHVNIFGRALQLRVHPSPGFFSTHAGHGDIVVGVAGLLLTLAAGVLVGIPLRQRRMLEREVEQRTLNLREKTEELRRLSTVVGQSPEAIILTDPDGRILYVNRAFERITGYSRDAVLGRNPNILKSGEQGNAFYAAMWDTITSGRVWQGRFVNKRRDGTHYTEDAIISAVRDDAGRISGYAAVKRDVSAELARDEQLRQSQKMDSIGRLAGGVAHDLNNLLTPILGYSQIILEVLPASDVHHEGIRQMEQATLRARDLVRQLLAFSRKQELQVEVIDLNHVLTGFQGLLRRALRENIQMLVQPHTAPLLIHADSGQIEQILMNLAVNAQDAIAASGTLEFRLEPVEITWAQCAHYQISCAGRYARLTVSDDGCGIPPDIIDTIFDPFFTTKAPGSGTGLGLSTVFGIVKQHKGGLHVTSTPGAGASFALIFPLATADAVLAGERLPEAEPERGRGSGTVWIVEDDESVRNLTYRVLQDCGYRVTAFAHPVLLLEAARQGDVVPDLLVTDVVMPDMSGYELARELLALRPTCRVMYMSGYSRDLIELSDIPTDAVFLRKPFAVKDLIARVAAQLQGNASDAV